MSTPNQKSRVQSASASKKFRLGFKSPFLSASCSKVMNCEDSHVMMERLKEKERLLDEEIAMLQADGCQEEELQDHIDKLHQYNEMKDVAQMVMGRIAILDGVTTKDIHARYGLLDED